MKMIKIVAFVALALGLMLTSAFAATVKKGSTIAFLRNKNI